MYITNGGSNNLPAFCTIKAGSDHIIFRDQKNMIEEFFFE